MTLTKEQLRGDVFVKIMNVTVGGKRVTEGVAKIVEVSGRDRQGVFAKVRFEGDNETCGRWVFARDQ